MISTMRVNLIFSLAVFCAELFTSCNSNNLNQNVSSIATNDSKNTNVSVAAVETNVEENFDAKSPIVIAKILNDAAKKNDIEMIEKNVTRASAKLIEEKLKDKDPETHASIIEGLSGSEFKEGVASKNNFVVCVNGNPRTFVMEDSEWKYDLKSDVEGAAKELEKQMDIMTKQGQEKALEYREKITKRDEAKCQSNSK